MTTSDEKILSAIAEQASEWFVTNQSSMPGEDARTAFVTWLRASPLHVEEYLAIAMMARDLQAAVGDEDASADEPIQAGRDGGDAVVPFRRPGSARAATVAGLPGTSRRLGLAAAAALTTALIAGWWLFDAGLFSPSLAYETSRGQQGSWVLGDGSLLRLDGGSNARVRYTHRERVIELRLGRAFFAVAQDPERPFRVAAGSINAVAAGTRFAVDRAPDTTVVTVAEGSVVVVEANRLGVGGGSAARRAVQQVNAGYQLRVDTGVASAHPAAVDLSQALAWLHRKIAFEHRPLGEVADEFNRYGQIPLQIDDAELRVLPVSGVFDAGDVESFVAFLATFDGVRVERTAASIRISREARPSQKDSDAVR